MFLFYRSGIYTVPRVGQSLIDLHLSTSWPSYERMHFQVLSPIVSATFLSDFLLAFPILTGR